MDYSTEHQYGEDTIEVRSGRDDTIMLWIGYFRIGRSGAYCRVKSAAHDSQHQAEGNTLIEAKAIIDLRDGLRVRRGQTVYQLANCTDAAYARRWIGDYPIATDEEFLDKFPGASVSIFIGGSQTI